MATSFKDRCPACGRKFTEHKGLIPTCEALQVALRTLKQIASTPRNHGAKRHARATVAFLETQLYG